MMTPTPGSGMVGQSLPYWQKDLYDRNKPLTDDELDQMIPTAGYEVSKFNKHKVILENTHIFPLCNSQTLLPLMALIFFMSVTNFASIIYR